MILLLIKGSEGSCTSMAEYTLANVSPTSVSSAINSGTQPVMQFPSFLNSANSANDPVVTDKGIVITPQKYITITAPWKQNTNVCTEVSFWLYYNIGEIGEFAGLAIQNLQGISKYMLLKGTGTGSSLTIEIYSGSQVVNIGIMIHGWNLITFGICTDYLNTNLCQASCANDPDNSYVPLIGNYVSGTNVLFLGCMTCTDNTVDYLIYSFKVSQTNSSCVFTPVKYAMTNPFYPCGDGMLGVGETCDDGNMVSGDGCTNHCILEAGYSCYVSTPYMKCDLCGNGLRVTSEICDDSNLIDGDGCSSICVKESGWSCTGGSPTSQDTCTDICGDGLKFSTVATYCDDGNIINGDGCDSTCTVETGWTCTGGSSTTKDVCKDICGDGIRFSTAGGSCDDGNILDLDGCNSSCIIETGWACGGGSSISKDICTEICGDGIKYNTISTYCDDGNFSNGDGCNSVCSIETGWQCSGGSTTTKDICIDICGDGKKYSSAVTFCEDGNTTNGDGCSSICSVETGYSCTGGTSTTPDTCTEICGDGIRINTLSTYCDDSNTLSGDGCSSTCSVELGWICSGGSITSKDICSEKCGDGKRFNSITTYCDDSNIVNGDGCSSTCSVETGWTCSGGNTSIKDTCTDVCGDGMKFTTSTSFCEDGNSNNGDGCSSTCSVESGWSCSGGSPSTLDTCSEICGDSKKFNSLSTYCDDGNNSNNDGCSSTCTIESGWTCSGGSATSKDTCTEICGDGKKFNSLSTYCDDGNLTPGDGCNASCNVESGYRCTGGTSTLPDTCSDFCGDGKRFNSLSTYCDDGNNLNGDGCNSACAIESGWVCSGGTTLVKDTCSEICGDGKRFNILTTYCDDGNLTPGDGCSSTCTVETYYTCTGGNSLNKDTCKEICGDGVRFNSIITYCDDGNVINNDGCSSICNIESGWLCSGGSSSSKDACTEICGDGKRFNALSTYCDDGNLSNGDGCNSLCNVETHYVCSGGNSLTKDTCSEICGDGVKFNSLSTYCDDSNILNGDGCSSTCAIESGWVCSGGSSVTKDTCSEICGDGKKFNTISTYCDDGNTNSGDGCSSLCSVEAHYTCSGGNSSTKDICIEICGDGVKLNLINTYCDDNNVFNGDGCNSTCSIESGWTCSGGSSSTKDICSEICGDSKRFNSISTYCDDGNTLNGDGCSSTCVVETYWSCSGGSSSTKDTCLEICGDGRRFNSINTYCDDGNSINNDGCNSSCGVESGWTCSGGSTTTKDTCTEICGDGKRFNSVSTYCDDGNSLNGDGCSSSCGTESGWTCSGGTTSSKDTCVEACGDGKRNSVLSTACDDGNIINGDGCSSICIIETGWVCSGGSSSSADTCSEICGDGIRFNSNSTYCDDGNMSNGDGCSSVCSKETGWICAGGNSSTKDVCNDICGDGKKYSSISGFCDDANTISGDGCSSSCGIESGWTCSGGTTTNKDTCVEICGDGKKFNSISTYCDDGNNINSDGCNSLCTTETGWSCSGGTSTTKDTCTEICGDGKKFNSISTYCDDGNTLNGDGCSISCSIEIGWLCSGGSASSKDVCVEICGDSKRFNILSSYCDDGNTISNDGCSSSCSTESGWTCLGGTSSSKDTCSEICGDGIRFNALSTYCDDGNSINGDGCNSSCTKEVGWTCSGGSSSSKDICIEICGDGIRFNSISTYCDDGNIVAGDGCSSTCSVENGSTCTGGSTTTKDTCSEQCGDGKRINTISTYCDDANLQNGDGCSSTCFVEAGWSCAGGSLSSRDICTEICGDGIRMNSVQTYCDDGNIVANDGCSIVCSLEVGWTCSGGNASSKDICSEICGDGIRYTASSTYCDDGNTSNNDGCSSGCNIEIGWTCTGNGKTKDICKEICGDGIRFNNNSTYCDDGNNIDGDGCSSKCKVEWQYNCNGGNDKSKDICTWYYKVTEMESNAALTTQIAVGVGAGANAGASIMTLSPFIGVWAMLNQFQMLLLIMISYAYVSDGVKYAIIGMDFTMLNFNFIKLENFDIFESFIDFFTFTQYNQGLDEIGITSGNSSINLFKLIYMFLMIIIVHILLFPIISKMRACRKDSKFKMMGEKLFELFTFSIYVRLILQSFLVMCLSVASEISLFNPNDAIRIISFSISCILLIILFLYFLLCWYQIWKAHPDIYLTNQFYFLEFFTGLKNSTYARMFPAIHMMQRILCAILLVLFANLHIVVKLSLLSLIHLTSVVYFLIVRPFVERRDLLLEAISQLMVTCFTTLLIYFNDESKWNSTINWMFIIMILATNLLLAIICLIDLFLEIKNKIKKLFKTKKIVHVQEETKPEITKIVSKLAKMQEMIRVPTSRREEYKFDMSESNPTHVNIQLDIEHSKPRLPFIHNKLKLGR